MLVYKLCNELCLLNLIPNLGDKLGDGADGEVFKLIDDTNKVIKLCVLYESGYRNIKIEYENISDSINHIINSNYRTYAKVFSTKYLGQFIRSSAYDSGQQNYILHYYIMEKLYKISEDEKRVFHSIISHEDRGIIKNYPQNLIKEMLIGMKRGLDFDMGRVMFFCDNFRKTFIIHNDVHVRNIMKDAEGNFKLIDFDRISLEK